jgi:signal transduction histidine kinase
MEVPDTLGQRPFGGIVQRLDIQGTIKFILQLQPETRRVVVVGGVSTSDQMTIGLIQKAAGAVQGVQFEFWTNRPMAETARAVASLPNDTVVVLSSVLRDVTGRQLHTSQAAQMLAPSASVPVYGMGGTLIGSGVLGGKVMDLQWVGAEAGRLALRALDKDPAERIPVEVRSNGVPIVDWRALQRWHIKASRLPTDCVVRYRPHSVWEDHQALIMFVGACLLAQAITIVALLAQRRLHRRAESEILLQRTELAHVARISTMGQLASALTHELNQPLGAILKNTEAAEIFLQNNPPNLEEVRAILTDIRRDDRRAGRVIDRMRALYKRRSLALDRLNLRDLLEDTVAMTRPDADARQIKVTVEMPPHLPEAQGDRVHLQQVLLNLILNGMDAMRNTPVPQRSLAIRVMESKNGNLQVAVSDHGSGITPDDAANIFEPFFTTKSDGMGMGLAISQTIIEAHGGHLWVDSSAMKGTTFTFILPPAGLTKARDGDLPAPR